MAEDDPHSPWRFGNDWKALSKGVLFAPALIGGLWSMSWQGAVTAFFWATLMRIAFLHHITWSINSIWSAAIPHRACLLRTKK